VAAARDALGPREGIGVLGFCLGGLYARLAAAMVPGLHVAVEFYGRIVYPTLTTQHAVQPLDLLPGRACPLQCHFGELDTVAPPAHVDELERRLASQAHPARVHRYAGCGHGFLDPRAPAWNEAAATLAWARALRWLEEHLPADG
jgi:carboxymethylenebutenolidase